MNKKTDPLDLAFEKLEVLLPNAMQPMLRWLRSPDSRMVRIPLGILFILASSLWFLPVLGIELLPIGLLLIAQDVPFMRRPVGLLTLWLIRCYERALRAWHRWRARRGASHP